MRSVNSVVALWFISLAAMVNSWLVLTSQLVRTRNRLPFPQVLPALSAMKEKLWSASQNGGVPSMDANAILPVTLPFGINLLINSAQPVGLLWFLVLLRQGSLKSFVLMKNVQQDLNEKLVKKQFPLSLKGMKQALMKRLRQVRVNHLIFTRK